MFRFPPQNCAIPFIMTPFIAIICRENTPAKWRVLLRTSTSDCSAATTCGRGFVMWAGLSNGRRQSMLRDEGGASGTNSAESNIFWNLGLDFFITGVILIALGNVWRCWLGAKLAAEVYTCGFHTPTSSWYMDRPMLISIVFRPRRKFYTPSSDGSGALTSSQMHQLSGLLLCTRI